MSTFELKLTFATADDLYAAVARLAGEAATVYGIEPDSTTPAYASPVIPVTVVEAPLPAKPARAGRPKKVAEPEAPAPVVSAATGAAEQDPAPVVAEPKAEAPAPIAHLMPTGDEVKSAAEAVNAKVGIVGLKKLLAKYNAARISEIAPENRAAFIADCQQVA